MDINKVNLKSAYNGSYYTITGAGGDLQEWIDGYNGMLKEQGIGQPKEWFTCKGTDINREYSLTGDNRFQDDLTFLFFPLDGLDGPKLAVFKIRMEDRWFDDIVDNAVRREEDDE